LRGPPKLHPRSIAHRSSLLLYNRGEQSNTINQQGTTKVTSRTSRDTINTVSMDATGKRKREEDYDNDASTSPLALVGVGGDASEHMLAYLEHPDRLALAAVCKTTKSAVEDYSRTALARIMKEHVVDDSFEERLTVMFASAATKKREVPQRCLLHAAHGTYLCTLKLSPAERRRGRVCLAISKDNSRLVAARSKTVGPRELLELNIWELADKKLQQTIEITAVITPAWIPERVRHVIWMENVVVVTNWRLLVFATDNEETLLHDCRHLDDPIWSAAQKDEATIIFFDFHQNFYSFDVTTGVKRFIVRHTESGSLHNFALHSVVHKRWLVATNRDTDALVIMDLQNLNSAISTGLSGGYFVCQQLVRCGSTPAWLYVTDGGKVEDLAIDAATGHVSTIREFFVSEVVSNGRGCCRGYIGDTVFLSHLDEDGPFMSVRNTKSGRVERLHSPPGCRGVWEVLSTGKEIFVMLGPNDAYGYMNRAEIAVYMANNTF